jgi:hypothetical protein
MSALFVCCSPFAPDRRERESVRQQSFSCPVYQLDNLSLLAQHNHQNTNIQKEPGPLTRDTAARLVPQNSVLAAVWINIRAATSLECGCDFLLVEKYDRSNVDPSTPTDVPEFSLWRHPPSIFCHAIAQSTVDPTSHPQMMRNIMAKPPIADPWIRRLIRW